MRREWQDDGAGTAEGVGVAEGRLDVEAARDRMGGVDFILYSLVLMR